MVMVRKQIYLDKDEDEYVKRRARELGTTEAAVIRELIKKDSRRAGGQRNKAADDLLELMRKRRAQLPKGGSTVKFDRESLYER